SVSGGFCSVSQGTIGERRGLSPRLANRVAPHHEQPQPDSPFGAGVCKFFRSIPPPPPWRERSPVMVPRRFFPRSLPRRATVRLLGALAVLFPLLAGCVTLDSFCGDAPPRGIPCQLVVTWHNQVAFTANTAAGGAPMPGLAGRLYLFGTNVDYPLAGDG